MKTVPVFCIHNSIVNIRWLLYCNSERKYMTGTEKNKKAAEALNLYDRGYNCSQAVAGAWCGDVNLPFETAVMISSGFGGGMGKMREVCGAVSAAFMILGMACSNGMPGTEPKKEMYDLVRRYAERFKEENEAASVLCRDITGISGAAAEEFHDELSVKLRKQKCRQVIALASALLEEFITDEMKQKMAGKSIEIVTFGNFAVYVNGKSVKFRRSKSCEALAFLVDRRTPCTKKQIAAVLFEDRTYDRSCQKYVDNILRGMTDDLREAGAEELVLHTSNSYSVNQQACVCDYYEYLNGNRKRLMADEYMSQYSWAEDTLASLR